MYGACDLSRLQKYKVASNLFQVTNLTWSQFLDDHTYSAFYFTRHEHGGCGIQA
jgi:hypothetical protein